MKLAVVGGGSTYTPNLIDGLARLRADLPLTEVVLIDPDERRLDLVAGVSRRILRRAGHSARVTTSTEVELGAAGADAVLIQLRVGGQTARHQDETVPLECGCVGQESVGAGGLATALRTVPVVLDLAERIASVAPRPWFIDFTNPVGIVTRALLDAGHRAIGLCDVAIGLRRHFASLLGLEPERVSLDHVGLNHLTWERAVYVRGEDVLPRLLAEHGPSIAERVGLPESVLRRLGMVPSYYLRYFYEHDAVVAEQKVSPSRASVVAAVEDELLRQYADPTVDTKPDLLGSRGGAQYSEAAAALLASLFGDARSADVHVVNVRNNGTLAFLPDTAVVEVPATVTHTGAQTWPTAPIPPLLAGLIGHVSAYETLAVRAAINGGEDLVTEALLAHPLIGQVSVAEHLAARIIAVHQAHLPWASVR
ncbi:family 4 glycosyl hydrolase [Actinokineospora iranica]|uniref:6-phospho-beta-glucosidase n=1 Tax=Actinokineospora iranica TaxID=1271860 RepID=A0A1G6WL25_9PSEU|nr:6-phospho-beta-glucosidase [Actinokineospora iranica]SDD65917.1 6-phospho-beta-glucosidase [Actinokineospora iranica]